MSFIGGVKVSIKQPCPCSLVLAVIHECSSTKKLKSPGGINCNTFLLLMYKNVTIHDCIINRRHGRGESNFKYPMQAHKLVRLVSSLGANMLNSSLNMRFKLMPESYTATNHQTGQILTLKIVPLKNKDSGSYH